MIDLDGEYTVNDLPTDPDGGTCCGRVLRYNEEWGYLVCPSCLSEYPTVTGFGWIEDDDDPTD